MGLEIIHVTANDEFRRIALTSSSGGFSNVRITKYVTTAIAGANTPTVTNLWENIESVPILIFRVIINVTQASAAGAGEYAAIGIGDTGAAVVTDIMDSFDTNTTGWYDNVFGPVTMGATNEAHPIGHMNAHGAATNTFLNINFNNGDSSNMIATAYVFYVPLE